MFEPMLVTLILIFAIPLVMVVLTLISKKAYHRWISLAGIGLVLVGMIALGLGGEVDIATPWAFLGEPITFSLSLTSIMLFGAALLVLGYLIMHQAEGDDDSMTRYQWGMVNLSISFGFVAFISGQFMLRYIALDIVGLLAALTVLSTFSATSGLKDFIVIFQILRLGDLSLLASILLINHFTGTLDISQMIIAAVEMPPGTRTWAYLGFLLAVLIKLAIFPFGFWLKRARQSAPRISFWISGVLLPVLGAYLLYRIIPIINSAVIFRHLTLISAVALAGLIILLTGLQEVKYDRFAHTGGILSCFLLAAAAFGGGQVLLYYLLGLILHRWLLLIDDETESPFLGLFVSLYPLLINGLFLLLNPGVFSMTFMVSWGIATAIMIVWELWMQRHPVLPKALPVQIANNILTDDLYGGVLVRAAGWLNKTIELGIFTHGLARMSDFFQSIAEWVYNNVEMGMEYMWIWLGRKLIQISEGTLRKVEVKSGQSTRHLMEEALHSLEVYEQKGSRKPLRWDLAWIPFLLVVILIMLFVL